MLSREQFQSVYVADLDPFTEKTKLAEVMGLHRNTIGKWHTWANLFLDDYKAVSSQSPLMSRYQCWVMGEIHRLAIAYKRKPLIWAQLKTRKNDYSIYKFTQIYKIN